jgi:hypothetical protein
MITPKEREEFIDVFAWSYKDMPGLYRVPLVEGCKSVKQVKVEIEKQWNTGFLEVVKYPQWVSNIVVLPKKEDKIKVCLPHKYVSSIQHIAPYISLSMDFRAIIR